MNASRINCEMRPWFNWVWLKNMIHWFVNGFWVSFSCDGNVLNELKFSPIGIDNSMLYFNGHLELLIGIAWYSQRFSAFLSDSQPFSVIFSYSQPFMRQSKYKFNYNKAKNFSCNKNSGQITHFHRIFHSSVDQRGKMAWLIWEIECFACEACVKFYL